MAAFDMTYIEKRCLFNIMSLRYRGEREGEKKRGNFQMENCIIFPISAQDTGPVTHKSSLDEAAPTSTTAHVLSRNRKNKPQLLRTKVGSKKS